MQLYSVIQVFSVPLCAQQQDWVSGDCREQIGSVGTGGDTVPFWDMVALKCDKTHDSSA